MTTSPLCTQASLESDLQSHIERHAGGVADLDALSRQLQAAQSSTAALGAEAAELRAEVGQMVIANLSNFSLTKVAVLHRRTGGRGSAIPQVSIHT